MEGTEISGMVPCLRRGCFCGYEKAAAVPQVLFLEFFVKQVFVCAVFGGLSGDAGKSKGVIYRACGGQVSADGAGDQEIGLFVFQGVQYGLFIRNVYGKSFICRFQSFCVRIAVKGCYIDAQFLCFLDGMQGFFSCAYQCCFHLLLLRWFPVLHVLYFYMFFMFRNFPVSYNFSFFLKFL